MFQTGTMQTEPDFRDTDFVVKITSASQIGLRWWYAAVEQVPQSAVSQSTDTSAALLYQDHPYARTFVLPGGSGNFFLTEINNRQLNVNDLVRVRHKSEMQTGSVFEAEAGGGGTAGVYGLDCFIAQSNSMAVTAATATTLTWPGSGFTNGSLDGGLTVTNNTTNFILNRQGVWRVSGGINWSLLGSGTYTEFNAIVTLNSDNASCLSTVAFTPGGARTITQALPAVIEPIHSGQTGLQVSATVTCSAGTSITALMNLYFDRISGMTL